MQKSLDTFYKIGANIVKYIQEIFQIRQKQDVTRLQSYRDSAAGANRRRTYIRSNIVGQRKRRHRPKLSTATREYASRTFFEREKQTGHTGAGNHRHIISVGAARGFPQRYIPHSCDISARRDLAAGLQLQPLR